jgi:hypothetical protein
VALTSDGKTTMGDHIVELRDTNVHGQPVGGLLKLDLSSGYVYDRAGNQVDRWTAADNEKTAMLADYASSYADEMACFSMSLADKQRAEGMRLACAARAAENGDLRALDLGPSDVHIPSAMPNFASGYKNEPPIADLMAPPLLAGKQVDDYYQFAKEDAYQRATPMASAGGGEVAEITPRLSNDQYSCKERALAGYVPSQVEANADAPLRILQATTRRVMSALMIEREIRVSGLLQNTSNWNSAQVQTIAAGAQWNGGASSDPIKNIHTAMENSYGGITAIGMSEKAYHEFCRNAQVQKFIQFKDNKEPLPSPGELSTYFQLPPILVGKMKYISAADTSPPTYVWGNDVVLIRQPEEMPPSSQEDVATAYTFRWNVQNPKDGVATNGWIVRQFFVQSRGSMGGMRIVVVHNDAEKMTSKFAGGLLHNVLQ